MRNQRVKWLFSLVLGGLLFTSVLWAGGSGRIRVHIPFAFYAVDQFFPAGDYFLTPLDRSHGLKIERINGTRSAWVMLMPASGMKMEETSCLVFYRYGTNNFLRQIGARDAGIQSTLWKSNREKEMEQYLAKVSSREERLASVEKIVVRMDRNAE